MKQVCTLVRLNAKEMPILRYFSTDHDCFRTKRINTEVGPAFNELSIWPRLMMSKCLYSVVRKRIIHGYDLVCLDVETLVLVDENTTDTETNVSIIDKIKRTPIDERRKLIAAFNNSDTYNYLHGIRNIEQWSMFLLDPKTLTPWIQVLDVREVLWYISVFAQTYEKQPFFFIDKYLNSMDTCASLWCLWRSGTSTETKLGLADLAKVASYGAQASIQSKLAWNTWCCKVNSALKSSADSYEAERDNLRSILKYTNWCIASMSTSSTSTSISGACTKFVFGNKVDYINLVLLQVRLKSIFADLDDSDDVFGLDCVPYEIETDFSKMNDIERVILSCAVFMHPNFVLSRQRDLVIKCLTEVLQIMDGNDSFNGSWKLECIRKVLNQNGIVNDMVKVYKKRFAIEEDEEPITSTASTASTSTSTASTSTATTTEISDMILLDPKKTSLWNKLVSQEAQIPAAWRQVLNFSDVEVNKDPATICPISRTEVSTEEYIMRYKHCAHKVSARCGFEWFLESREIRCPICNQDTNIVPHSMVSLSTVYVNEDLQQFWLRNYEDDDKTVDDEDEFPDDDEDDEEDHMFHIAFEDVD